MFGNKKKTPVEIEDTPVRLTVGRCGNRPLGKKSTHGEEIFTVFVEEPGTVVKVGKNAAARMIERGSAAPLTPEETALHGAGLAFWDTKEKRWAPTPKGALALSNPKTDAAVKKQMEVAFC